MKRAILIVVGLVAAAPAAAAIRQFSYDPADEATRDASGAVTFVVRQGMFGSTVLAMRATEARATADLARVGEGEVGGLVVLLGRDAPERALYRIGVAEQGADLAAALCPGSKHAWLALSPVRYGAPVKAAVIGDAATGPKVCARLDFVFRGEWRRPARGAPPVIEHGPPSFPN